MKINRIMTKTVVDETTYELTAEDIAQFIMRGIEDKENYKVDVFFDVPGGGDWSNDRIYITKDDPIKVRIVYKTEEREDHET